MKNIEKLFDNKLILILVFFILIKPGSFSENIAWKSFGDIINIVRTVICGCTLIISLILITKKKKIMSIYIYIIVYYSILFFSTIIHGGAYYNLIVEFIIVVTWGTIFELYKNKDNKTFWKSLEITFDIIIIINFLTIIIFPNGFYKNSSGYSSNYFLGYDNNMITFILPALCISFINAYKEKKKINIRTIILYSISLLSIFITWSATSVFAIILLTIMLIASKLGLIKKEINIKKSFAVIITIVILLVILRIQNIFEYFIVDFLKKDLTFTGRTLIWDLFISKIKQAPLLGYGIIDNFKLIETVGAGHAHDLYLNIMFQSGIIGLIVFCLILYKTFKTLKNNGTQLAKILSLILFIYMFTFIFEAYATMPMFFIVIYCCNYAFFNIGGEKDK